MIKNIEIPKIGEFLQEEFLTPLKISQNALAKAINVSQNRISEIVNNRRGITIDTDLRLCKYFGLSEGYFFGIQEDFEKLRVKKEIKKSLAKIVPYTTSYKQKALQTHRPQASG